MEVEGVIQQGCGGELQVDLEHQDCGPRMFSSGSLQVCLSLSSSLHSRWPQKPNYRTLFIFLETIISNTARSVWSPHLYKQYDRRGTKQSLLLYSRLSFHSGSYSSSETRSDNRAMPSDATHSWSSQLLRSAEAVRSWMQGGKHQRCWGPDTPSWVR